ncbi:FAD-binding protein [Pseudomonas sp. B2M1-30]|uniref:FAD-binding oxidoreductase n=1 Tax=Pseudomonas TaxID=286 RepID=UPI0021C70E1A|nr:MULTISPECIES: FAD-linked oxidase C-terminal domain-containing protein [Pseudomonas]MCU0120289.1 FAD-binding protein [Pseudomonas sp. B2M1-30]MCU7260881.1 FAD-binding protein [Pseudomonas koreensis]
MNTLVVEKLRQLFGERLKLEPGIRKQFCQAPPGVDLSPPDAVVSVFSEEEIVQVVRLCRQHGVPLIPAGARSSLEGQINAPCGGVCIDCSQMNAILDVNTIDMTATVQPGVTREQLNSYLRETGLFFSVDPGANASMGGMAATRASGTNSVRYGTMAANVKAARWVMADGAVAQIGSRAPKSAMGLDLLAIAVGSEGTLGIFSELEVRLHPQPEAIVAGVCAFDSVDNAVLTVAGALGQGLSIARIELLDVTAVRACNAYSPALDLPQTPHLFLEFHGDRATVASSVEAFTDCARENGGHVRISERLEERTALWKARHDAWWAFHAFYQGRKGLATDVCVPLSCLSACISATAADIADSGLDAPLIGHVGDGNFHLLIMLQEGADESEEIQAFLARLSSRALAFGGTVSGEHGVGQGKVKWMSAQHGAALPFMQAIKSALDPENILNPGKMYQSLAASAR